MSKVLLILAEGFEELEAITVIDILRRADIDVTIAALNTKTVVSTRKVSIVADMLLDEVKIEEMAMVILPGGQPGTNNLAADLRVIKILQKMRQQRKYVAAICAAPYVLSQARLLEDKQVTAYPAMRPNLKAKQIVANENTVIDDKIITSQGPGTAIDFSLKLVGLLHSKEKAEQIAKAMLVQS